MPFPMLPLLAAKAVTGGKLAMGAKALGGLGFLKGLFGKKGIDPTTALLGGLSMFGGGDGQKRQSFKGTGAADPRESLRGIMEELNRMTTQLGQRKPERLGSSIVQGGGAEPLYIPGIGQIGGGMASDPALADPSLLDIPNPVSAMSNAQSASRGGAGVPVARRRPRGGR